VWVGHSYRCETLNRLRRVSFCPNVVSACAWLKAYIAAENSLVCVVTHSVYLFDLCLYVCTCMYIYIYIYIYMRMYLYVCMHAMHVYLHLQTLYDNAEGMNLGL
jgi:hypothetical protein